MSDKILGIDLGTTNCVVSILEGEEPTVIPNAEGQVRTPSVVHIDAQGKVLIGEMARRMLATHPERTVFSAKRLVGHYYSELEEALKSLPFPTSPDEDDNILIGVDDKLYQPQQIQAMILEKLRRDAEEYLGESVTQAIITVPANFDDLQRTATKEAGRLAGLDVLRLVNEPTAAAMAYGLGRGNDGTTAVFDFGGGTFDVTLMDISGRTFEVMVSEGDTQLGGDDIDNLLVQMVVDEFYQEYDFDLTSQLGTLVRVKEAAEKVKCELSTVRQATINLPFLTQVNGQPVNYERTVSRTEFEELCEPLIQRCFDCCQRALEAARIETSGIKRVILVGGSTRIPLVQQMVEEFFGMPPHRGVNPDEIVAMGAATQAGVLAGDLAEVILLDVSPRSLGIETRDDSYSVLIEKNSTIPIKAAKTFTTTEDNQEMVVVHVLQGEEREASANLSLGKFVLKGLEPSNAGAPRIRVTFHINADGILEIGAQDMATGVERQLTITHTFLTEEERRVKSKRKRRRGASRRKKTDQPTETGVRPANRAGRGDKESTGSRSTGGARDSRSSTGRDSTGGDSIAPSFGARTASGIRPPTVETRAVNMTPSPDETGGSQSPTASQSFAMVEEENRDSSAPTYQVERASAGMRSAMGMDSAYDFATAPKKPSDTEVDRDAKKLSKGPGDTEHDAPQRVAELPDDEPVAGGPDLQPSRPTPSAIGPSMPSSPSKPETWSPADFVEELKTEEQKVVTAAQAAIDDTGGASKIERAKEGAYSEQLRLAITFLDMGKTDAFALKTYDSAIEPTLGLLAAYENDPALLRYASEMQLHRGQLDQSYELLHRLSRNPMCDRTRTVRMLSMFIEKVPSHLDARRDRARLYGEQGMYEGAIKDLEFILQRQSQSDEVLRQLESTYIELLESRYSPSQELKLIKILLRRDQIDEAIKRLQNIIEDPQYRARAQKVLGFCYWQKQMYYPAFLQFKNLPITDELKDSLYRLAADMEAKGDNTRALEAFEHLNEKAHAYRDVEAAIARLRAAAPSGSKGGSLGGPPRQSVAGEPGAGDNPRSGFDALKGSRFIILEELNRGSMGIVFKAKDQTLNEIVALKMLNDFLCTDPLAIERFKREARAAKKLSHQRIVRIHDLFEMNGKTFLSMEFIAGFDLKKHLQTKKKLTTEEASTIAYQVCSALEYAHKRGVIHRDIKPANILFDAYDPVEIKVADFGIAKQLNSDDMTTGSRIMGTPLYMAPEQIEGRQVDARSDLYSLGIMMYEMMTGNAPFMEGNIEYQHIHMEPPPLPEYVDPQLQRVIMRAIAKRKEDRFQSAKELAATLAPATQSSVF